MPLVYLIRHARTQQEADVPAERWVLSEAGTVAAAALAGRQFWTAIGQVITSTEVKSVATAAPALELWDLPHVAWESFDEVKREGYAATQEAYEARVRQLFARAKYSDDGWERGSDALKRGVSGLERALDVYSGQNLAIVGHGLLWALVRAHLLGEAEVEVEEWKAVRFPDVSVWQVEEGIWRLVQDFEGIRALRR